MGLQKSPFYVIILLLTLARVKKNHGGAIMNKIVLALCLALAACATTPVRTVPAPHWRETLTGEALTRRAASEFLPRCGTRTQSLAHSVDITFRGNGADLYRVTVSSDADSLGGGNYCFIEIRHREEASVLLATTQLAQAVSIVALHDNDHTGHFSHDYDQDILEPLRVLRDGHEQMLTRSCRRVMDMSVCEHRFALAVRD